MRMNGEWSFAARLQRVETQVWQMQRNRALIFLALLLIALGVVTYFLCRIYILSDASPSFRSTPVGLLWLSASLIVFGAAMQLISCRGKGYFRPAFAPVACSAS